MKNPVQPKDETPYDALVKARKAFDSAVQRELTVSVQHTTAEDEVLQLRKALDLAKAELDKTTKELVK